MSHCSFLPLPQAREAAEQQACLVLIPCSDTLSRPCHKISLDRWPGVEHRLCLGCSDLGLTLRSTTLACVTLGKSEHASEPQFLHLSSGDDDASSRIVKYRGKV